MTDENPRPIEIGPSSERSEARSTLTLGASTLQGDSSLFFVSLAQRGRSEWNDWREGHPEIPANFENIDFRSSENFVTDFSGFNFGNAANFRGCYFGDGQAKFANSKFGADARFQNTHFGSAADFSGVTFGKSANFEGAYFGPNAQFARLDLGDFEWCDGAIFDDYASFYGAWFDGHVNFNKCRFGVDTDQRVGANFSFVTFGPGVDFSFARFGDGGRFSGAAFGDDANFTGVGFGKPTMRLVENRKDFSDARIKTKTYYTEQLGQFNCTIFGSGACLVSMTFEGNADLTGIAFGVNLRFSDSLFRGGVTLCGLSKDEWREIMELMLTQRGLPTSWSESRRQEFWSMREMAHKAGAEPDTFPMMSLARTRFRGDTNLSGRKFLDRCNLTAASFKQPPVLEGCEGTDRIDFYGAKIGFSSKRFGIPGWTVDSDVAIRLRSLRMLAEETKNHDLERDLYIEERKAERGILLAQYSRTRPIFVQPKALSHCAWIAIMAIYWLLADYGRSLLRPVAALLAMLALFQGIYTAMLVPNIGDGASATRAVTAFTIANSIPFVGTLVIDKDIKEALICGKLPAATPSSIPKQKNDMPAPSLGVVWVSSEPVVTDMRKSATTTCLALPSLQLQALALIQSILSALLFFFIAMALRNYFKLR